MNYELITNNQRGFAHLAVILLLLAGIGLGTYLVQNRTNLFPQAFNCDPEVTDCSSSDDSDDSDGSSDGSTDDGRELYQPDPALDDNRASDGNVCAEDEIFENGVCKTVPGCTGPDCGEKINQVTQQIKSCREGGGTWTGYECVSGTGAPLSQAETQENIKCASDQVTYCDGGSAIRKTGGYFDTSKNECVFDFFNVREKDSECDPAKGALDGGVVSMTAEEARTVDQQRASGQRTSDAVCPSETVCKGGKRVIIYRTENEEAPGCKETEYQTGSNSGCTDASGKPLANGTKLEGNAKAEEERKFYEQGQQRIDLKKQIDDARLLYDKDGVFTAENDDLTRLFVRAQELLNTARLEYDKCFTPTGVKKSDCGGQAEIANAQAVMATRLALIEAAASGKVPGLRVKADLSVGGASNSLLEARPSTGGGTKSRVFLATDDTGKKANFVVLNAAGSFVFANAEDLKALGLSQGIDVSTIPTLFKDRIDKAQCAVDKTCPGEGAVTPQTGQTGNSPAIPAENSVSDNGKCTDIKQCKSSNQYGKSTCIAGVCKAAQAPVSTQYDPYKACNTTTNKCPSTYPVCKSGKCCDQAGQCPAPAQFVPPKIGPNL